MEKIRIKLGCGVMKFTQPIDAGQLDASVRLCFVRGFVDGRVGMLSPGTMRLEVHGDRLVANWSRQPTRMEIAACKDAWAALGMTDVEHVVADSCGSAMDSARDHDELHGEAY